MGAIGANSKTCRGQAAHPSFTLPTVQNMCVMQRMLASLLHTDRISDAIEHTEARHLYSSGQTSVAETADEGRHGAHNYRIYATKHTLTTRASCPMPISRWTPSNLLAVTHATHSASLQPWGTVNRISLLGPHSSKFCRIDDWIGAASTGIGTIIATSFLPTGTNDTLHSDTEDISSEIVRYRKSQIDLFNQAAAAPRRLGRWAVLKATMTNGKTGNGYYI